MLDAGEGEEVGERIATIPLVKGNKSRDRSVNGPSRRAEDKVSASPGCSSRNLDPIDIAELAIRHGHAMVPKCVSFCRLYGFSARGTHIKIELSEFA